MFFTTKLFNFLGGLPEEVSADGLQLGYRLSLINEPINLLSTFCSDDVPETLSKLISQHKRWYAGNIEYGTAYRWATKIKNLKLPIGSYVENIFLNSNWILRPFLFIGLFLMIFFEYDCWLKWLSIIFLAVSFILYCYVAPYLTSRIMPVRTMVRIIDWICLPVAILIKSIGPIIYLSNLLIHKVFGTKITLKKVER